MTTATRVLVSAGSKHGSTLDIASRIADVLAEGGLDVDLRAPEEVAELAGYAAIVIGSSVYAGHWQANAKELAGRIGSCDPLPLVWLFSSGPLGDPPKPVEDPVDVASIVETTSARDHRLFAGSLDKAKLSFGERAIVAALRAPEGDFRDWDEISRWADEITDTLRAGSISITEPSVL
ncbi:MAG: flavodoxin domain-containing protein [Acidimicrobiia bacterium]